ncbi:Protein ENHANCED DISEASE RESISTANCE 2 [Bienertia sinuspersici]
MGGCYSTHAKPRRPRKKLRYFCAKRRKRISDFVADGTNKPVSNAESHPTDAAVSQYLQKDPGKGDTTAYRRSEALNSSFIIRQMQWHDWHHDHDDTNGACPEEAWFDSASILESDSDDEFSSLHSMSLHHALWTMGVSMKNTVEVTQRWMEFCARRKKLLDRSLVSFNRLKEKRDSLEHTQDNNVMLKAGLPHLLPSVSFNDLNFLPSSGRQSLKKKSAVIRLSFKRRSCEGEESSELKRFLYRPRAGLLIPCSSGEKLTAGCWAEVPSSKFNLRGKSFFKDKKKSPAPDVCPYKPFGADLFICQRKINHIAQHLELPSLGMDGKVPPILIVNIQVPTYPAAMFGVIMMGRLSESFEKDISPHFQDCLKRKAEIIAGLVNPEDLSMSSTEESLCSPTMKACSITPQHNFYKGQNYFEIDLDVHRFSYISRKGLESFRDQLKNGIIDLGLTIQAQKPEELPEQMLCCLRLSKIDFVDRGQIPTIMPVEDQ